MLVRNLKNRSKCGCLCQFLLVQGAAPALLTGKWNPFTEVVVAKTNLRRREIVTWHEASPTEQQPMVVEEAASVPCQAQHVWTGGKSNGKSCAAWSFMIGASPTNRHLRYGVDPACPQYAAPATRRHILVVYKEQTSGAITEYWSAWTREWAATHASRWPVYLVYITVTNTNRCMHVFHFLIGPSLEGTHRHLPSQYPKGTV